MKQSNKRHILLRYSLVVGVMILFSLGIIWFLARTTLVQAAQWNEKADKILTKTTATPPERGKLLADNGAVLAANMQFYTPRIDWLSNGISEDTLKRYLPALADSLALFDPTRNAQQWKDEIWGAYQRITDDAREGRRRNHSYRLFKGRLTHSEYERVRNFPFFSKGRNNSGFHADRDTIRCKPYGSMASRSIGSVRGAERGDTSRTKGTHGRSGLEKAFDELLYGTPGVGKRVQLTHDIISAEIIPATPGYDITTTINIKLQDIVETELHNMCLETDAEWGTCVLMEVATGEIKAISNLEKSKTNPGEYIEGSNNAVLGYEPGSVMKPISMMVALEDGIVNDIDQPMTTGTTWIYEGRAINDPHGGAQLTPRQIIETSSNVGMSRIIAKKYGPHPDGFRSRLESMGFFEPFNLGIAGERTPRIQHLGNTRADRVALTRMAFGYSTLIPPMSVLAIYNAIANDGKFVRPRLVKRLSRAGEPDSIVPVSYIRQQVCSPENARKLRIMMHDVVWGSRGTARRWVQDERVPIAGKTGTAYTITKEGGYGTQKRLAFCGFFPYDKPKYTCITVMLGANRGAGASSGMVVKNVALKMYARGLLGNAPQYAEKKVDKDGKPISTTASQPTFFASTRDHSNAAVKRQYKIDKARIFHRPGKTSAGSVPNVTGLSVREAVKVLEDLGLSVRFKGTGFVAAQSIAAGAKYARGQVINLTLRH